MKRLLSILLVLMLMLSMTATAFAAGEDEKAPNTEAEQPLTKLQLTKTYNDPVGYGAKFFFQYELTYPADIVGTNTAPTLVFPDISYAANHPNDVEETTKEVTFDNLGKTPHTKFIYKVKENQTFGNPNSGTVPITAPDLNGGQMKMSQAEYDVTVIVAIENGKTIVKEIAIEQLFDDIHHEPTDNGKRTELAFVNTYAKEAGPTPENPDDPIIDSLTVSKTVVNALNDNDTNSFAFTVDWKYPAGGNPFGKVTATGVEGITITNTAIGGQATFNLQHNHDVAFDNLPIGTVVNVTENGVQNYKPAAAVEMGGVVSSVSGLNFGDDLTLDPTLSEEQRKLGEGKNAVGVTNTFNYVAPTGVILNVLPYVLMVAIAGGMIVLFTVLKRRNAQDNED